MARGSPVSCSRRHRWRPTRVEALASLAIVCILWAILDLPVRRWATEYQVYWGFVAADEPLRSVLQRYVDEGAPSFAAIVCEDALEQRVTIHLGAPVTARRVALDLGAAVRRPVRLHGGMHGESFTPQVECAPGVGGRRAIIWPHRRP